MRRDNGKIKQKINNTINREEGMITIEASTTFFMYILAIYLMLQFISFVTAEVLIHRCLTNLSLEVSEMSLAYEDISSGRMDTVNQIVRGCYGYSFNMDRSSEDVMMSAWNGSAINAVFRNNIEDSQFGFTNIDQELKRLGVKGGLEGIDFSSSYVTGEHGTVCIRATYSYQVLSVPIFGEGFCIEASQSAETGVWR